MSTASIDLNNEDSPKLLKRGRGRPKGEWTGRIRYRPKKWLPEFNQLVIDYIVVPGCTHEMLGEKYGYKKDQICNILGSAQARDIQEGMAKGILKYNVDNSIIKLGEISKKITERLHNFIHEDSFYRANPFEFINKSLSIGKAIGSLNQEREGSINVRSTTNNTQVNVAIGTEAAIELGKSIRLANELRDKGLEVVEDSGQE